MHRALADPLRPHPAALALAAAGAIDPDDETRDLLALVDDGGRRRRTVEGDLGDDQERRQQVALTPQQLGEILRRGDDRHGRLEAAADQALGPRGLERFRDLAPDLEQSAPLGVERIVEPLDWHLGKARSEEHTSELQSRFDLVCRLLLEKKKKIINGSEFVRKSKRMMV